VLDSPGASPLAVDEGAVVVLAQAELFEEWVAVEGEVFGHYDVELYGEI
jgi:hypothetical protein